MTYVIDQLRMMDTSVELRVGAAPLWGYDADSTMDSSIAPGWTMTVNVGDTIKTDRLRNKGSMAHDLTIKGLGIAVAMADGTYDQPFDIKATTAGTFPIECSLHPGEHGTATLVVK